jgi:hypothetical protein
MGSAVARPGLVIQRVFPDGHAYTRMPITLNVCQRVALQAPRQCHLPLPRIPPQALQQAPVAVNFNGLVLMNHVLNGVLLSLVPGVLTSPLRIRPRLGYAIQSEAG